MDISIILLIIFLTPVVLGLGLITLGFIIGLIKALID